MTFEVLNKFTDAGFHIIKITEGEFKDVEFSYGAVEIEEKNDECHLKFDFNVISDPNNSTSDSFGQYIGNILLDILEEQVNKESVVYAGGK